MSDDMNMSGQEPIVPEGTVAPLPAPPMIKPGMARRNVFLIIAGVIVLVALVGFVGYAVLLVSNSSGPSAGTPGTPGIPAAPGTASGTPSATSTAALPLTADISFRDVFTPRDPFHPVKPVQIAVPAAESNSSSSADDNSSAADESSNNSSGDNSSADTSDILTLLDIVPVDGAYEAVVRLNNVKYTLGAGDQVGDSTYSIVAVDVDSVDVMHGDETYTIMLGD